MPIWNRTKKGEGTSKESQNEKQSISTDGSQMTRRRGAAEDDPNAWKSNSRAVIATDQRLLVRSVESLIGLASGFLADGHLSDDEIRYLDIWLRDNRQLCEVWPGEIIFETVQSILADGIISEDERDHLTKTLQQLIGTNFLEAGATSGESTGLPIDNNAQIIVPDQTFCFTGTFIFGTRTKCLKATEAIGGMVVPRIVKNLNFLVVGTLTTQSWAHTSFGRKIEKAIEYRDSGTGLLIVSEDQWMKAL